MKHNQKYTVKSKPTKAKTSCPSGKVRYRDHREAVVALHSAQGRALADLLEKGDTSWNQRRAYSCNLCKGHHLTSQPLTSQKEVA